LYLYKQNKNIHPSKIYYPMPPINIQYFKTNFGELVLGAYEDKLCLCDWRYRHMRSAVDLRLCKGLNTAMQEKDSEVLEQTRLQLDQYFASEREKFDLPLLLVGTDFQKSVWNMLLTINYGTTATYLSLSEKLGNAKAIRAVASANGANAISIIVPCHRIIGSDGELVGYAGGLDAKRKLLRLEGKKSTQPIPTQISIGF
jgi:methylated-DNA-[protein]-cysteine S-methyltransferase